MAKKYIYIFIGFFLVLLASASIYAFTTYKKVVVKPNKTNTTIPTAPTATPTIDPDRPYSVLLMGYGGGTHQGGYLTDSMIVAQIVPKQKQINIISIPRDLWVSIPIAEDEEKLSKINFAYAVGIDDKKYPNKKIEFTGNAGGGEMAKFVASNVVGFDIDNFVTIDFQGFIKTIDKLGGIPVKVKTTFDDYLYPLETNIDDTCGKSEDEIKALTATMSGDRLEEQFSCRYEQLHFDAGLQTMSGETALKFARSRHSKEDGGDFNRAARQQLLITSIKDRVFSLNFIPKIIPFINTLSNNMRTDIDLVKMQEFVNKFSEIKEYKIKSLALTDKNALMHGKSADGQFILIPKEGINEWSGLHDFITASFISTPSSTTE